METKFTKGEWKLLANTANQKIYVINQRHCLLAHCYAHVKETGNQPLTLEEAEANAKLIAAAPDLLKLAVDFCSTFESTIGYQKYYVNVFKVLNDRYIQAKSAIKKATE